MKKAKSLFSVLLCILMLLSCMVPAFAEDVDPATCEHEWQWVVDKEATCTEAGSRHEECTQCHAKQNENTPIEMTAHQPKSVAAKEPTCGEAGNIACYQCKTCGQYFRDEACTQVLSEAEYVVAKLDHAALAHTAAVKATCDSDGNIEYWYCADCGNYYSDAQGTAKITVNETIEPALGHNYVKTDQTAESCVKEGTITYTCSHDPTHTYTESIPTVAHADNNGDGNCDKCGMGMNRNNKTGIAGFFAKIGMFFRNLFWFFNELLK